MSEEKKKNVVGRVTLEGPRLSLAESIWTPRSYEGDDGKKSKPKHSAHFLIPKGSDLTGVVDGKRMPIMTALKKAKIAAMAKKLGDERAKEFKIKPSNYAVRDGDQENRTGYRGNFYVSASSTKKIQIIGRDKRPLAETDGIVYSGCYVNAIVTLWFQAAGFKGGNPVPDGVHATLEAIQFVRDGEAFGAPGVDVDEDFEDLTDGEDDLDDGDLDDGDRDDSYLHDDDEVDVL